MNSTIPDNASTLWHTVSDQDTGLVYKQAFAKTWKILKQAFRLFLLLFLFFSAAILWIWGLGFHHGRKFRMWIEDEKPPMETVVYNILRVVLWPLERAIALSTHYIENTLGWQDPFEFKFLEPANSVQVIPPAAEPVEADEPVAEPSAVDVDSTTDDRGAV